MSQYYPIVSLNDVIRIRDKDIDYCLLVTKLEPSDVVQTINCDISLEFEDAIDLFLSHYQVLPLTHHQL